MPDFCLTSRQARFLCRRPFGVIRRIFRSPPWATSAHLDDLAQGAPIYDPGSGEPWRVRKNPHPVGSQPYLREPWRCVVKRDDPLCWDDLVTYPYGKILRPDPRFEIIYAADAPVALMAASNQKFSSWWAPLSMAHWMCRMRALVLDARVRRLSSLTDADARAETGDNLNVWLAAWDWQNRKTKWGNGQKALSESDPLLWEYTIGIQHLRASNPHPLSGASPHRLAELGFALHIRTFNLWSSRSKDIPLEDLELA